MAQYSILSSKISLSLGLQLNVNYGNLSLFILLTCCSKSVLFSLTQSIIENILSEISRFVQPGNPLTDRMNFISAYWGLYTVRHDGMPATHLPTQDVGIVLITGKLKISVSEINMNGSYSMISLHYFLA